MSRLFRREKMAIVHGEKKKYGELTFKSSVTQQLYVVLLKISVYSLLRLLGIIVHCTKKTTYHKFWQAVQNFTNH